MPSLKSLRKRIATVRSTQQITRAMKMVAAARLRRAHEAAERARPYTAKLAELFASVAAGVEPEAHPLLARRPERRIDLLVLTSDRGLCGGYNANLFRHVASFLGERGGTEAAVAVVGRKGFEYYRRRSARLIIHRLGILTTPPAQLAADLAGELTQRFAAEESDAAYLLYNRFRSAISQVPTATRLLPVATPESDVPQALLEAVASEHGARMTAMDNATTNATEMIGSLTLSMNRARQAAITKELMEIVSGAEALKG